VLDHTPWEWARICRTQAALTADPQTKAFLLQLAEEYEAIVSAGLKPASAPEPVRLKDGPAAGDR
jgi:hypothetical protein